MKNAILFGLDGATYTILDDLVQQGVMPYLGKFMSESARGPLLSIVPPLTPPAWTSIVTGRSPGHHGITNFMHYDRAHGNSVRLLSARDVCAETMWSIAG